MIEKREDDRVCRGGGRQVEGVAGKVRSDNARAGRLIHREDIAGGDTRTVCYSATTLRGGTRSQGKDNSAASDGYRAVLE